MTGAEQLRKISVQYRDVKKIKTNVLLRANGVERETAKK